MIVHLSSSVSTCFCPFNFICHRSQLGLNSCSAGHLYMESARYSFILDNEFLANLYIKLEL